MDFAARESMIFEFGPEFLRLLKICLTCWPVVHFFQTDLTNDKARSPLPTNVVFQFFFY